jgi:phosphatidylinositol alpha-1,6-mannosyltransferase
MGQQILFLATDAYGGHGGIAYYNRCLAQALAEDPGVDQVTVLPRVVRHPPTDIPPKVNFKPQSAGRKARYLLALAHQALQPCHLVICGHINLLPLAWAISRIKRAPLVLQVHGIDAWQAPASRLRRWCTQRVHAVWSVSQVTRDRMNAWARLPLQRYTIIPNTIHPERYGIAPRRQDLVQRYGLQGRKVILTLGRLDARERYKGIDEILESLPALLRQEPTLCYLIAGDGDDQARLAAKARQLGVADHVVFAGYVPEADKADTLRLADVFAMPGRGEGFGIVYLEAMACGVPVVGSPLDGSREALREGELGILADPRHPAELQAALLQALHAPRAIPPGLQHFAWPSFAERARGALKSIQAILSEAPSTPSPKPAGHSQP